MPVLRSRKSTPTGFRECPACYMSRRSVSARINCHIATGVHLRAAGVVGLRRRGMLLPSVGVPVPIETRLPMVE